MFICSYNKNATRDPTIWLQRYVSVACYRYTIAQNSEPTSYLFILSYIMLWKIKENHLDEPYARVLFCTSQIHLSLFGHILKLCFCELNQW